MTENARIDLAQSRIGHRTKIMPHTLVQSAFPLSLSVAVSLFRASSNISFGYPVLLHIFLQEWLLGQGTIYPDTIETGGTAHSSKIKTHHNRIDAFDEMIKTGRLVGDEF